MAGIPKTTVANLLKTASHKIVEQENELAKLRQWYNESQTLTKAAHLADRMVESGHLDLSERDAKAYELAGNPENLPVVEQAINMVAEPSAFEVASIADEPSSHAGNARTQFESYLLGDY